MGSTVHNHMRRQACRRAGRRGRQAGGCTHTPASGHVDAVDIGEPHGRGGAGEVHLGCTQRSVFSDQTHTSVGGGRRRDSPPFAPVLTPTPPSQPSPAYPGPSQSLRPPPRAPQVPPRSLAHLLGARVAHHGHNLVHGGAPHDGVVDQQHRLAGKHHRHRVQLAPHRHLAEGQGEGGEGGGGGGEGDKGGGGSGASQWGLEQGTVLAKHASRLSAPLVPPTQQAHSTPHPATHTAPPACAGRA